MKKLLSPESRAVQIMTKISDYIFINLIFVVCCIPVFTIGAAQSALARAARAQLDGTKDESCYKAFFSGFKEGFRKITVVWLLMLALMAALTYVSSAAFFVGGTTGNVAGVMATAALLILAVIQPMTSVFHSRFECSAWEIVKNSMIMLLMYPLRCAGTGLLIWAPVLLLTVDLELFVRLTPIFLFIFYTLAIQIGSRLMRGPFERIEEQFLPETGQQNTETGREAPLSLVHTSTRGSGY